MPYTSTDLTGIQKAIATGARTVQFENRLVTYRDLAEMLRVEQIIADSLAGLSAARVFTIQTKRGLEG